MNDELKTLAGTIAAKIKEQRAKIAEGEKAKIEVEKSEKLLESMKAFGIATPTRTRASGGMSIRAAVTRVFKDGDDANALVEKIAKFPLSVPAERRLNGIRQALYQMEQSKELRRAKRGKEVILVRVTNEKAPVKKAS